MKLPKSFLLLCISIIMFGVVLSCYLKSRDILLTLNIGFSLIMLVVGAFIAALIVSVEAKKSEKPKKEEHDLKKITVFFPCVPDELDKLDLAEGILQLKPDQIQVNGEHRKDLIYYVKKKKANYFHKTLNCN